MAFIFGDGFDAMLTADLASKWPGSQLQQSPSTTTLGAFGIGGGNGVRFGYGVSNTASYIQRGITSVGTTSIFGFHFNPALNSYVIGQGNRNGFFHLLWGGSNGCQISLRLNNDYSVMVVRDAGGAGVMLGNSNATLSPGALNWIEFKVVVAPGTGGSYELRFNGTAVSTASGIDTAAQGVAGWTSVRLGSWNPNDNEQNGPWDFDNFYCCDGSGSANNDFLGAVIIKGSLPDAAGNYSQFTPSASTNVSNVDDATPNGDTDYNSAATAGLIDTYNFAALGITGTVKALQINHVMRSNGSGSEFIAPVVRIAGTDYVGTTVPGVLTSYQHRTFPYDRSPATAGVWTVSEIDGAEFGLKLVS